MNRNPRIEKDIDNLKEEEFNNNDFIISLQDFTNQKLTENLAITNKSSKNYLLDFYMLGGSLRNRTPDDIIRIFELAKAKDKLRTLKCLFYIGDIREGLGERRTFRILLKHIAYNYPKLLEDNMYLIPYYNRWDSLFELFETPLEEAALAAIGCQLASDLLSDEPSLLAKWLPSVNASSKITKKRGIKVAKYLKLGGKNASDLTNIIKYRKTLKLLREKLNVVECKMARNEFNKIDYSKVPSIAANRYSEAFLKKDKNRYVEYIENLINGNAKINASVLFPHYIVGEILEKQYKLNTVKKIILEKQWNSLPDYCSGKDISALVVADVSGSMYGTPISVAVAMALYMSEKIEGPYKNKFITFSREPELIEIVGDNIVEKAINISKAKWGMNTDIEKVFDLILEVAVRNNLPKESLPKYLYIISDMEFDSASKQYENDKETLFKIIKNKFDEKGYAMPRLIFWNVDARSTQSPMTTDENGWLAVSGFSQNIFKALMNEEFNLILEENEQKDTKDRARSSAEELMYYVLDSERYSLIRL